MSDEPVLVSREGAVAIASLNRPERRNALDIATWRALREFVIVAEHDPSVRAVLLTGEGAAFSAGADLKSADENNRDVSAESWTTLAHRTVAQVYRLRKPTIAAVNGVAVGAGLDLALATDFRIGSSAARFGSVYVTLGIAPDVGSSYLLPQLVGVSVAKELIYTGRIIDADEAFRIGLLREVVGPQELAARALEFATALASGPTVAIGFAKQNIQDGLLLTLEAELQRELIANKVCEHTEDVRIGIDAVMRRERADFLGR